MNEAELVAAFQGYIGLTNQLFFGYVSLLSGYLVMSYLVADKISTFLTFISLGLFSIVSVLLLFGMFLSTSNAEHIMVFLRASAVKADMDLSWLGSNPPWATDLMSALYILATFGGYVASIVYFFYKRRHCHLFEGV